MLRQNSIDTRNRIEADRHNALRDRLKSLADDWHFYTCCGFDALATACLDEITEKVQQMRS